MNNIHFKGAIVIGHSKITDQEKGRLGDLPGYAKTIKMTGSDTDFLVFNTLHEPEKDKVIEGAARGIAAVHNLGLGQTLDLIEDRFTTFTFKPKWQKRY